MTDRPLVEKRLAIIDTSLAELRRLAHIDRIDVDIRERRFVERTLQVAIQAALDVASHIVSDRRLGEPATNRDSFLLLERDGWVLSELRGPLADMAGFRNVLVHGYDEVDLAIVRDVVTNHLDDLALFAEGIRRRLRDEDVPPDGRESAGDA
ncbi:MAG: DUF86 domain-containing protein [Vicinamibacterales bacterium]